ncbi:carbonic anhydrase [Naumannella sp. ID2617S]|uniref:carbonic anhydrase n=1 Tax=Enemella dayhoffiae TaxID=2016507 RepID=A0A255H4G1_9ACTN|nr:carbonic anhydrase [Enemella dayhoffiae]NNG19343.1 carbonic anhydrase [Naumannella sp. ID2617S]OYO22003.1 carbonic anhydrase [Enemella dayhoffiae]
MSQGFDDLLQANERYATDFNDSGFDGIARAGVAIITCMDSRITPLAMVGLKLGDAKIMRTPGGRITSDALVGCILSVHLLNVDRIMIVPHTRCAMGSGDDATIAAQVLERTGADIRGMVLGSTPDQKAGLSYDVRRLRNHPLLKDTPVEIGGFLYDVDTGRLNQVL